MSKSLQHAAAALAMVWSLGAFSAPVVSQVGNLLTNGNFEAGTAGTVTNAYNTAGASALSNWNQYANSGPVTSEWSSARVVDGAHSAYITGSVNDGLYQYHSLSSGTYTVSGWFFVEAGTVHLGLSSNSGSLGTTYSGTLSAANEWQYLSWTGNVNPGIGPILYGFSVGSRFYADGLWMNAGATSTSLYDPGRGFNPNATGLPEPGSLALAALALSMLATRAGRVRGRR